VPVGSSVSGQRRPLKGLADAQPLPADVTVTAAELGGVPTAEITVDGIAAVNVVLYFHGGVYVLGDAFQAADLAAQVGRRTRAKVFSVDYRLAGCRYPPRRCSCRRTSTSPCRARRWSRGARSTRCSAGGC
jgi:monoterpene epsilon-lactone hydrolase